MSPGTRLEGEHRGRVGEAPRCFPIRKRQFDVGVMALARGPEVINVGRRLRVWAVIPEKMHQGQVTVPALRTLIRCRR